MRLPNSSATNRLLEILTQAKVIARDGCLSHQPNYKVNEPVTRAAMTTCYRLWYQEWLANSIARARRKGSRPRNEHMAAAAAATAANRTLVLEANIASLTSRPQPSVPTRLPQPPYGIDIDKTELMETQVGVIVRKLKAEGILRRDADGWILTLPSDQD
jgi:hypothetical protein